MFVLIAGGGRTGMQLATLLLSEGYKVRLIEHRAELLTHLHQELPTEVIYEGKAIDPEVLEAAGVRQAHILAACTADDASNLVLCFMARHNFGVPRTIARVNNPRNEWLFSDTFHVDVALNQANVLASLIREEMSLGDMMTLLKIRRGRYSLVEEKVEPGARAIGVPIMKLGLPDECIIAAIIRDGKMTLPRGDSTFQAGDEIVAVASPDGAKKLSELLAHPVYPVRKRKP